MVYSKLLSPPLITQWPKSRSVGMTTNMEGLLQDKVHWPLSRVESISMSRLGRARLTVYLCLPTMMVLRGRFDEDGTSFPLLHDALPLNSHLRPSGRTDSRNLGHEVELQADHSICSTRSSLSIKINNLTHAGGVNSIESFARSWQRAVGFHEITPVHGSFAASEEDDREIGGRVTDVERSPLQHRSLLRQQLESQGTSPENAIHDDVSEQDDGPTPLAREHNHVSGSLSGGGHDIFSRASYFGSPFGSIYGGTYGAFSPGADPSSRREAVRAFREQQAAQMQGEDKEHEPLLFKRVEQDDGKVVLAVVGQSTIYQTVLNSTNVLIGVGLLSLPLGIKYAGWVVGLGFLTFSALITAYTAKLLGKCLSTDESIITFADIAYVSFGSRAQIVIAILFSLELIAACVALFVLFADSLDVLIPGWGIIGFKLFCGLVMIPMSFVPLRFLGITSSLGIVCCLGSR